MGKSFLWSLLFLMLVLGGIGCRQEEFPFTLSSMTPPSRAAHLSPFNLILKGTFPQVDSMPGLFVEFNSHRLEILDRSADTLTCLVSPAVLPTNYGHDAPVKICDSQGAVKILFILGANEC